MERVTKFSREPVDDNEIDKGTEAYLKELEARQKLDEQRRDNNSKESKQEEQQCKIDSVVIAQHLKEKLGGIPKLTTAGKNVREPVSLFSTGSVDAFSFGQMRSNVTFEFNYSGGDIPADGVTLFFKDAKVLHGFKLPEHFESVTLVTCVCTKYNNTGENSKDLVGALNIRKDYKPYQNEQKDHYEMQETMGTLPYASFEFGAGKKEERMQFALRTQSTKNEETGKKISYHFGNPAFVATVGKIAGIGNVDENAVYFKKEPQDCTKTELAQQDRARRGLAEQQQFPENCLWNGIIHVPGSVCKKAGLLLYDEEKAREAHLKSTNATNHKELDDDHDGVQEMDCGSEEEDDDQNISEDEYEKSRFLGAVEDENKIRSWFALDPGHVLLWPIKQTRPEVLKGAGMHVETFDVAVSDKTIRLCYLVSDVTFRGLVRSFTSSWADKTDFRKFEDIGITIAPASKTMGTLSNYKGGISFRVVCYFIFWKSIPPQGTVLKPTIHPDMPSFQQFVETPMDKLAHDFTAKMRI